MKIKKISQLSVLALALVLSFQAKAQKINIIAGFTSSTLGKRWCRSFW